MSNYGGTAAGGFGFFDDMSRRISTLERVVVGTPITPSSGPGSDGGIVIPGPAGYPPFILTTKISPVTDVVITPGVFNQVCYADVFWQAPSDGSASAYEIVWAPLNDDGSIQSLSSARFGGSTYRILNLAPNSRYVVSVSALNQLGLTARSPSDPAQWYEFRSTIDNTVPPPISNIRLAQGATSVIVMFDPLTMQQAPDVANGAGVYQIDLSNDPAFATIVRTMRTSAFVVAFNDIYPHTTLTSAIAAGDGARVSVTFASLSDFVIPGTNFTAMVDQEQISFTVVSPTSATIVARNLGGNAPITGPVAHAIGAAVVQQTQTPWYARVCAIDTSNNQGPFTVSGSPITGGGVIDSMIVGDISAAHITFGSMKGDRIETNTLVANKITTSSLTASTITLNGGSLQAGNPPTTGLVLNSQGLRLYNAGTQTVSLDAGTGSATFQGTISGSTISGTTFTWGGGGSITQAYGMLVASANYGSWTSQMATSFYNPTYPYPVVWSMWSPNIGEFHLERFNKGVGDLSNMHLVSDRVYIDAYQNYSQNIANFFWINSTNLGININGAMNAYTKAFLIDHPIEPDKKFLMHACVEGPEYGVYYRGEAQLVKGVVEVKLPAYFETLTLPGERTVQLTALDDGVFGATSLVASPVIGGKFVIKDTSGIHPKQKVYWQVMAVRADVGKKLEIEIDKDELAGAVAYLQLNPPKDQGGISGLYRRHWSERVRERPLAPLMEGKQWQHQM